MENITRASIQRSNPMIWAGIPRVKKPIELKDIIKLCCLYNCINEQDIYIHTRQHEIVKARQTAWYLTKKLLKYSNFQIGSLFGFDRTTVLHGINQIQNYIDTDIPYRYLIISIENKVTNPNEPHIITAHHDKDLNTIIVE